MTFPFGLAEHDLEQLVHHGADTCEKPRAEMPLQNVAQVSRRMHLEGLRFGVQLFFRRRKHDIAAVGGQLFAITLQRAGVAVKVFVG